MTRRKDPKPQQRTETETRVEPYKSLYNGISNGFQEKKIVAGIGGDAVILVESEDESPAMTNQVKWQQTDIDGIKIVSCVSMDRDLFKNQPAIYKDDGYTDEDDDDDDDNSSSYTSSTFSSLSEESQEEEDDDEPTNTEENELPNFADVVDRNYIKEQIVSPNRLNMSMGHLLECCDIFEPNFVKIKKISESSSVNDLCSSFGKSMRLDSKNCRVDLVKMPQCMAKSGAISEMVEHDDSIKWLAASEILTVGNLFSKLKLSWPRPKRATSPKLFEPPPTPVKESNPERSPIKITLRRTSSMAGSDSEPGPYVVANVGGDKKRGSGKRNFVTKRTTARRPNQQSSAQLSLPPPQPATRPSTASSVDDDSASSSDDSDSSDFDPDPDHILGCRSYEVENYNLNDILSLTIPFEDPGLFRSPRAASKAAQLKNKQTLTAAVRNQTPQTRKIPDTPVVSSPNESSGNIRSILRTMELKSLSEGPEVQEPELPPKNEAPSKKKTLKRRSVKADEPVEIIDETENVTEVKKVTKGAKRGPKPKVKPPEEQILIDESSLDSSVTNRDDETPSVDVKKGAKRGPKPKRPAAARESITIDESSQDSVTATTRSLRTRRSGGLNTSGRDDESLSSAPPSPQSVDSVRRLTRRSVKSQDSDTSTAPARPTRSNTKLSLKDVPELEDPSSRKPKQKKNKTEEEEDEETVEEEKIEESLEQQEKLNKQNNYRKDCRDSIMRTIDTVINIYAPPDNYDEAVVQIKENSGDEAPSDGELDGSMSVEDDFDDAADDKESPKEEIKAEHEPEKVVDDDFNVIVSVKDELLNLAEESVKKVEKLTCEDKKQEFPLKEQKEPESFKTNDEAVTPIAKLIPEKSITQTRMEVLRSLHKILEQQHQKEELSAVLPKRMLRDPRVRARLQREHEQVDRRTEESPRSPESESTALASPPVVTPPLTPSVSRIAKISPWPKSVPCESKPVILETPTDTAPPLPENDDDVPAPIVPPRPPTPPRVSSKTALTTPEEPGPSKLSETDDDIEDGEIRPKKKKKPDADLELTYKSPLEALESSTSKQSGYQRTPVFNKKPPVARDPRRVSSEEDSSHKTPELPNHKTPEQHHNDWPSPSQIPHQSPNPDPEKNSAYLRRPPLLPTPHSTNEVFHRRPWNFNRPNSPPNQHFEHRGQPPRNHNPHTDSPYPQRPPSNQPARRPQSIVYEDDPGERYLEELRQMENGCAPYDRGNYYQGPPAYGGGGGPPHRYDYDDYDRVPTPPPPPRWRTSPSPPPPPNVPQYRYDGMMRPRSRSRSPPRWKTRRTPSPPQYRRRRTPSPYRRPHRY